MAASRGVQGTFLQDKNGKTTQGPELVDAVVLLVAVLPTDVQKNLQQKWTL